MLWVAKHAHRGVRRRELTGYQVILRPPEIDDADEWIGLRKKNRNFLKPFEPKWPEKALTHDFFTRRTKRQLKDWEDDRAYSFLIFRRDNEEMIGGFNINNVCRGAAQYASLGYWIDEAHQGHGYMAAAMRMGLHFAYHDVKLHRMHAATLLHNLRSIKLLKRMGFQEEGRAHAYIEIDGYWQDHILFGLVLEQFMQREREG